MTERARKWMFFCAGSIFLALYCYSAVNLPPWGDYRGPYGDYIARLAVYERHATDTVNAVNYDYRGFDTLGEEFILFTAVVGVMMLLRREDDVATRPSGNVGENFRLSAAVRLTLMPALVVMTVFGFYIGLHGALTPGGGFQAGVILATAPIVVYLCENPQGFKRITSHAATEVVESIGAGSYAIVGVVPLLLGLPLLTNALPLGTTGTVFSAGNISVISALVGVEVTAAFLLVAYTYLEEIVTGEVPEG